MAHGYKYLFASSNTDSIQLHLQIAHLITPNAPKSLRPNSLRTFFAVEFTSESDRYDMLHWLYLKRSAICHCPEYVVNRNSIFWWLKEQQRRSDGTSHAGIDESEERRRNKWHAAESGSSLIRFSSTAKQRKREELNRFRCDLLFFPFRSFVRTFDECISYFSAVFLSLFSIMIANYRFCRWWSTWFVWTHAKWAIKV